MRSTTALYKKAIENLYIYLSRFEPLTRDEWDQMLGYIEIREFGKKAAVIHKGEVERYINVVASGVVRKYLPLKEEVTVQLASEGHLIHSELSFYNRVPSGAVIETIEPTILFSISYDSLQELYDRHPAAERIARLVISDLFVKKDKRFFDQLQTSTRDRFMEYIRTHPELVQRVPQKYIASYLNIKPETFSRLKHLLRPSKKG